VSAPAEPAPFTTVLDLAAGVLEPQRKLVERTLGDMQGMYAAPVPGGREREVAYRVSEVPTPLVEGNLLSSTTTIEPGTVDGEFHMTKGHFHAKLDRAEIYLTLAGEGRLVMATEEGEHAIEPMRRGTVNYVPGGWAHRSVNVGAEPLVFFAVFPADAGYDYKTIEEQGFPVLVMNRDGEPVTVPNPRYRG
jgi:glucose-6-phosphate isomerase, archaeal